MSNASPSPGAYSVKSEVGGIVSVSNGSGVIFIIYIYIYSDMIIIYVSLNMLFRKSNIVLK